MHYVMAIFFSSLLMCSHAFAGSLPSASPEQLSTLLNQRMLIMKAVAGYKAQHHLPIEDLPREQVVLENMLQNAQQAGLEPHSVEPFVHALMDASKAIQYRYRADWLSAPDNAQPVSDLTETRQQIVRLDSQLMSAISQRLQSAPLQAADNALMIAQLTAPQLSENDKKRLVASLSRIERRPEAKRG
ncbi:chorismate mutase [Pantoea sp. C2G6]|uniref:chorismate mutase n=1 Tax=Pantoea sp. C2G6 TaxID=3243084 RepID=UPI003ED9640B